MLTQQVLRTVKDIAREVSQREGCYLYDVEWVSGGAQKGRVLRVYIDKVNKGANLEDCANVSNGISLRLDVEDLIPVENYDLEVSTPGIERVLNETWHFEKAVGEKVKIRAHQDLVRPQEGKSRAPVKNLKGELVRVTEDQISVLSEGLEWNIPLESIQRAQVIYDLKNTNIPKKQKKRL